MVGVERFELPTHCSQSSCATRLRYTPKPVNLSMLRTLLNCVNPFPSYQATKNPINSKGHPNADGLNNMARPERLCRAPALPPAGSLCSFEIRSRRICRTLFVRTLRSQFPSSSPTIGQDSFNLARPERFELPTARFVAGYSIQLSYGRAVFLKKALLLHEGCELSA